MGVVAVAAKDVSLEGLHPKTRKEIEELGPEEVYRRRVVSARVYHRNDSPLAAGVKKEADAIAAIFGFGLEST